MPAIPTATPSDLRFMDRALELSARSRGRTSPNPHVGCVLVRSGEIVGEGATGAGGRPHAETEALAAAGDRAYGATAYVTLEPCAHHGRTGPCAEALRDAGVARVFTAMEDPDGRVSGRGHALLRESGIEVVAGVLEDRARETHAEYIHRVRTGTAFGVLKAAVTLDGRLGADGGDSRWITGGAARRRAHELRDRYDAVLIGRGTLDRDDPSLDVRHIDGRDPVAVVVTTRAGLPERCRLWDRAAGGASVVIATAAGEDSGAPAGADVIPLGRDDRGRADLKELFTRLAERGLNSVLIEGGEEIHTSALAAGVVQRAHVFVAPRILGGAAGPRLVGDLGIREVSGSFRLENPVVETLGPDVLISGAVVSGCSGAADGEDG